MVCGHRQIVGHQGVLRTGVVTGAIATVVGAAPPLYAVSGHAVFGADRDVQDLQLGTRVLGDLGERFDATQRHVLRIGHGAEHAAGSAEVFVQAANTLTLLFHQRAELPRP